MAHASRSSLPPALLVRMLKALKNMSMEHTTLDALQRNGAISLLVPYLSATPKNLTDPNHLTVPTPRLLLPSNPKCTDGATVSL